MAFFIELHRSHNNSPMLVNVEAIGYVEPMDNDTSILHMCGSLISSSGQSINGCMERVYVKESYQIVKLKLKEYE